ncbi:MAG: hypothetical protein ACR2QT_15715 [Woeseiaceae bacterium]
MTILDLWLPILVAGVVCFLASSVIWAVLKYHNRDYSSTDREDDVRAALKGAKPGYYILPYCADYADMEKPEMKQKLSDGPVAYISVAPNGMPAMGPKMFSMLIYFLLVSVICAYIVTRTIAPDADYLAVFRIAGTVAFIANGLAVIPESIWFARPWPMTVKNMFDALVYALLTGGIFGWLV